MKANEARMLALATSISDGEAVDWKEAERAVTDGEHQIVMRNLRIIENLAQAHKRLHGAPETSPLGPENVQTMVTRQDPHASSSAAIPEKEFRRWLHLEVKERVGRGGFGEVYRAWDSRLDREVALKFLRPEKESATAGSDTFASSLLKEGRLLARLRHPNVVTVYGAEQCDGRIGLWMEFVRGRTLEELVREQGPLGAQEATLIGRDLCRALAALHGAGLIHLDIKAQNVMREEGGRIVLMDLGGGVEFRPKGAEPKEESLNFTPLYMTPEILQGEKPTPQADLYSVGVLLYYLVTGSYPIEGRSFRELIDAHARRKAKLLRDARPDLPDAFVDVVERATAPDPSARFSSAGEMEQSLRTALGAQNPAVTGSTRRRKIALLIIAASLLAGSLVGGWYFGTRPAHRVTTTPAPAEPASLSTGESYMIEAALFRNGRGKKERLAPGSRVSPGDELFLEFRATESLHVYILNKDEKGESYLLFPLPEYDLTNPLAPGKTHRLPGARQGRNFTWQVTTAGGREHFLILAGRERLVEFEKEMVTLARPQVSRPLMASRLSTNAIHRLRGIGGLVEGRVPETGKNPNDIFERAQRLGERSEEVQGVWVRQIDLQNP